MVLRRFYPPLGPGSTVPQSAEFLCSDVSALPLVDGLVIGKASRSFSGLPGLQNNGTRERGYNAK